MAFLVSSLKKNWKDTGSFITRAINNSKELTCFTERNRLSIVTCIPKVGKPKQFLKNWRPKSLFDVINKLASGCIAERIKTVLDKIVSRVQTEFLKGRFICENIRLIYNLMNYNRSKSDTRFINVDRF